MRSFFASPPVSISVPETSLGRKRARIPDQSASSSLLSSARTRDCDTAERGSCKGKLSHRRPAIFPVPAIPHELVAASLLGLRTAPQRSAPPPSGTLRAFLPRHLSISALC